jgi:hypothetical protein
MNPADRTKETLLGPYPFPTPHPHPTNSRTARTEALCNAIYDERNTDPWGGDGYLSTILRTVKPQDTSDFSTVPHLDEAKDYYTSAQKELTVKEQTAGLVRFVAWE